MQFKIRLPIKAPKRTFKVNKEFKTKSEITRRTIEISEAFAIGVDEERTFTVFKDFVIDVNPGDIAYITGDSGGGKSILLKELKDKISKAEEFGRVISDDELKLDPDEILIEGVGKDTSSAVNILSQAGLNEAFLMLRRFKELSDGQKHRFKIAKMIDSGADTWFFDEFLATLDRTTACVVAYCVQKTARKLKKTVIAATTHKDLFEDLNPSVYIEKGFGDSVKVQRHQYQSKLCSLLSQITIKPGTRKDYDTLGQFHYRQGRAITKKIFTARLGNEVIAVIVYVAPHPKLRGRSLCLPDYRFQTMTSEQMGIINRDFIRIGRVVVHPKFRTIGLGVKMVRDTLPLVDKPYVETLAVMARYNPFFEHAGMKRIPTDLDIDYRRALNKLTEMGFSTELLSSKSHNLKVIETLTEERIRDVKRIVFGQIFRTRFQSNRELEEMVRKGDREAIAKALTKYRVKPEYLIWKNPKFTDYPEPHLRN